MHVEILLGVAWKAAFRIIFNHVTKKARGIHAFLA
jgi:hypothetical protein